MFKINITIGEGDVIAPYNHVHHADALLFLEKARVEFLSAVGFPLDGFLTQQLFLVVTSLNASYKRELSPGNYEVTCGNVKIEGKTLVVEQRIVNSKGKIALEAAVELMCVSGSSRRAITFAADFEKALVAAEGPNAVDSLT